MPYTALHSNLNNAKNASVCSRLVYRDRLKYLLNRVTSCHFVTFHFSEVDDLLNIEHTVHTEKIFQNQYNDHFQGNNMC